MDGVLTVEWRETLARQSLRWDAGYCIVMGAAMAVFFSPIAAAVMAPKPLIAIGGVATAAWGGMVVRMSFGGPWRRITAYVVVVNLAATAALTLLAALGDLDTAGRVVLGSIAIQVLGLAAVQAHALWSPFGR